MPSAPHAFPWAISGLKMSDRSCRLNATRWPPASSTATVKGFSAISSARSKALSTIRSACLSDSVVKRPSVRLRNRLDRTKGQHRHCRDQGYASHDQKQNRCTQPRREQRAADNRSGDRPKTTCGHRPADARRPQASVVERGDECHGAHLATDTEEAGQKRGADHLHARSAVQAETGHGHTTDYKGESDDS